MIGLSRITGPVLNVIARDDYLVPPPASRALRQAVGSKDYTEMEIPGGHIGIYVGETARTVLPDAISGWLRRRAGDPAASRPDRKKPRSPRREYAATGSERRSSKKER